LPVALVNDVGVALFAFVVGATGFDGT